MRKNFFTTKTVSYGKTGLFPQSPEGYSGTVEVFRDRNLLLPKREEGDGITFALAELDSNPQLSLLFSARTEMQQHYFGNGRNRSA